MARWPRTSTSSASAAASSARSSSWWWWLLPVPVASAFKRLLLRLMALWLNSPLRRLRLGNRRAFLRLGGGGDDDGERDHEMSSYEDEHERFNSVVSADKAAVTMPANADAVGLVNVGNTCFVNAILQCLAVLPAFRMSVEQEIAALQSLQSDLEGTDEQHDTISVREKQRGRLHAAKALLALLTTLAPVSSLETAAELHHSNDDRSSDQGDNKDEVQRAYGIRHSSLKRRRRDGSREQHAGSNGFVRKPAAAAVRRLDRDAVTAQVRTFLDAMRECTELISARDQQQEQQDAEEFLSLLLEMLHELVRCSSASAPSSSSSTLPPLSEKEQEYFRLGEEFYARELKKCKPLDPRSYTDVVAGLGDLRWQRFLKQNDSMVTDLFVGQIVRGSQCCSCANLTCLHQELRVLSLSMNANTPSQSLASCLEAHRHAEHLVDDNRVFCGGYCHMKTSRVTQVLFQKAPSVLVIQLQRFKQSAGWGLQLEKISTPVSFPIGSGSAAGGGDGGDLLDLTENMFVRNEAQHVRYKLVAVCAHVGESIDSGHYVAYVNHQQEQTDDAVSRRPAQWLRMDDDVVTALDKHQFREETLSSAYILFYTRVAG